MIYLKCIPIKLIYTQTIYSADDFLLKYSLQLCLLKIKRCHILKGKVALIDTYKYLYHSHQIN